MSRSNKESALTAHIRWPPFSKLKIQLISLSPFNHFRPTIPHLVRDDPL